MWLHIWWVLCSTSNTQHYSAAIFPPYDNNCIGGFWSSPYGSCFTKKWHRRQRYLSHSRVGMSYLHHYWEARGGYLSKIRYHIFVINKTNIYTIIQAIALCAICPIVAGRGDLQCWFFTHLGAAQTWHRIKDDSLATVTQTQSWPLYFTLFTSTALSWHKWLQLSNNMDNQNVPFMTQMLH